MPAPMLPTALSTTRDAWLSGDPAAWALYRSCCERLPGTAAPTGADGHRVAKSVASSMAPGKARR